MYVQLWISFFSASDMHSQARADTGILGRATCVPCYAVYHFPFRRADGLGGLMDPLLTHRCRVSLSILITIHVYFSRHGHFKSRSEVFTSKHSSFGILLSSLLSHFLILNPLRKVPGFGMSICKDTYCNR